MPYFAYAWTYTKSFMVTVAILKMKAIWLLFGFAVKSRQRIFPIFSAYVSRYQNTWLCLSVSALLGLLDQSDIKQSINHWFIKQLTNRNTATVELPYTIWNVRWWLKIAEQSYAQSLMMVHTLADFWELKNYGKNLVKIHHYSMWWLQ